VKWVGLNGKAPSFSTMPKHTDSIKMLGNNRHASCKHFGATDEFGWGLQRN